MENPLVWVNFPIPPKPELFGHLGDTSLTISPPFGGIPNPQLSCHMGTHTNCKKPVGRWSSVMWVWHVSTRRKPPLKTRKYDPGDSSRDLFWDGEFTWPEIKGWKRDLQRSGMKRARLDSPGKCVFLAQNSTLGTSLGNIKYGSIRHFSRHIFVVFL